MNDFTSDFESTNTLGGYVALISVEYSRVILFLREGENELSKGFISYSIDNVKPLHSHTIACSNIIGKYVHINYTSDVEYNIVNSIRISDTYIEDV